MIYQTWSGKQQKSLLEWHERPILWSSRLKIRTTVQKAAEPVAVASSLEWSWAAPSKHTMFTLQQPLPKLGWFLRLLYGADKQEAASAGCS